MIERYAKPGDFVQILTPGKGSAYGTVIEISEPWIALSEHESHEPMLIWLKPGDIILAGKKPLENATEADQRSKEKAGAMGMPQRAMMQATEQ